MLVACGNSDDFAKSGVESKIEKEETDKEKKAEIVQNLAEQYVDRINAYQAYYEKAKSDFKDYQVGATVSLDKDGLPLLWLGISKDGSIKDIRTRLVGFENGEAAILTERKEYIIPTFSSGIVLAICDKDDNIHDGVRNLYLYDDEKKDFHNITSELDEISKNDITYSESELKKMIDYLYPIECGISFANSVQIVMNQSMGQIAYIGKYSNNDFVVLKQLGVIKAIETNGEGDIGGYFLKKEYEDNNVAKQYYDKLANNTHVLSDRLMEKYGSEMASDDTKNIDRVFTGYDGTVFSTGDFSNLMKHLQKNGWKNAGLSHAYADDVEIGQLFRKLVNNPIYSSEELYLSMVAIANNCEITQINLNEIQAQIQKEKSEEQHDYLIYIENIDEITGRRNDNKVKVYTKSEVADRITGEEDDSITFPVSSECKFISYGEVSYGEDIKDFCNMIEETIEDFVGDEQPLNIRVVVEAGEIVLFGIGYGDDLTN